MIHLFHTHADRTDTAVLLPRAAAEYCAAIGRPCPDLTVSRQPGGKPFFAAAPWLHVSVSHSGAYWICACTDAPIGIDLQRIQPTRTAALARRFFHPDEIAWLDAHPDGFFSLWTAKESCVKLTGRGIDGEFSRFSVIRGGSWQSPCPDTVLRHLPFAAGYVLCLCSADRPLLQKELAR
ncbi:MAG: 4'-phosphopantetheinyl transferase superfamily protein [Clostridia bacterium]|nr:4'-phosphopantetheinyl transferase superfamily protein [Clostridia bacterium]